MMGKSSPPAEPLPTPDAPTLESPSKKTHNKAHTLTFTVRKEARWRGKNLISISEVVISKNGTVVKVIGSFGKEDSAKKFARELSHLSGNIDAQNHEVFKLVKEYEAQGLDLSGVVIPQFPQMHFELDAPTGDARLYLNGPKVLKTANVNDAIDEVQRLGLDQTLENRLAIDELQVAILKRMPNNHLLPEDKTSLHCAIEQQEGYIQAVKEARSLRSEKREAYAYHKARAQEKFQKQKESEKWARGADPKLLREYDEACDNRRAAKEEMDASEKAFYDLQGVEFTAAPLPPSPQPSAFGRIIDWARKNVSGSGEMTIGKVPLYRTPTPNRSDRNIPPLTSTVSPTKSLPQIT